MTREPPFEVQRDLITKLRDELAANQYLNQLKIDVLNAERAGDFNGAKVKQEMLAELTLGIENAQKGIELMEKKMAALSHAASMLVAAP